MMQQRCTTATLRWASLCLVVLTAAYVVVLFIISHCLTTPMTTDNASLSAAASFVLKDAVRDGLNSLERQREVTCKQSDMHLATVKDVVTAIRFYDQDEGDISKIDAFWQNTTKFAKAPTPRLGLSLIHI